MCEIIRIQPVMADMVFGLTKALVEKASEPTPETPASLLILVKDGSADMWVVGEGKQVLAVVFTQVLKRPKDTVYNVIAGGGTQGKRWLRQLRRTLTADALARGADKAVMMRVGGHRSYFGSKPAGYYYEDALNA